MCLGDTLRLLTASGRGSSVCRARNRPALYGLESLERCGYLGLLRVVMESRTLDDNILDEDIALVTTILNNDLEFCNECLALFSAESQEVADKETVIVTYLD